MNCNDARGLMADALGGELSEADRSAFDSHCEACRQCRRDYETAALALDAMRSLPAPQHVQLRHKGRAFVAERPAVFSQLRRRATGWSLWRHAASVLVAFSAGVAVHAGWVAVRADRPASSDLQAVRREGGFDRALVAAHSHNPRSSDLTKCMAALFPTNR